MCRTLRRHRQALFRDVVILCPILFLVSGCPTPGGGGEKRPAGDKAITSFFFPAVGATGVINEGAKTIAATVPYGTDVTTLVAEFRTTGVAVTVWGTVQVSGTTVNDFSYPVIYTVAAADGSFASYTATVDVGPGGSVVTTLAGKPGIAGWSDGTGTAAGFHLPVGVATDGTNLYVVDDMNHTIRKVVISTGEVTTFAGSALSPGSSNGQGSAARFYYPGDVTSDGTNLYVTDHGDWAGTVIRKIVISTAEVTTFAASSGIGITNDGTNLYVADYTNSTIRQVAIATGTSTTLAGSAGVPGSADGTGAEARFYQPYGLTTDGTCLYVADKGNCTIRKVEIATGVVTTLAGSAGAWGSKNGTGSAARFSTPGFVTTDGTNLYVTDNGNVTIRKIVISTGEVTTLAGGSRFGSDDGMGSSASFNNPAGIAIVGANLYVADYSTIRAVTR